MSVWKCVKVDDVWRYKAAIEDKGKDKVCNIEQTAVYAFAMLHSSQGEKGYCPGKSLPRSG